jgi:hypothetical protein
MQGTQKTQGRQRGREAERQGGRRRRGHRGCGDARECRDARDAEDAWSLPLLRLLRLLPPSLSASLPPCLPEKFDSGNIFERDLVVARVRPYAHNTNFSE